MFSSVLNTFLHLWLRLRPAVTIQCNKTEDKDDGLVDYSWCDQTALWKPIYQSAMKDGSRYNGYFDSLDKSQWMIGSEAATGCIL